MDRKQETLKYIDLKKPGVEIAPYANPLIPKSECPGVLILDVFDTSTLLSRAVADPNITPEAVASIDSVDMVGDAADLDLLIEELPGSGPVSYVVSSHNFEHLPNPIKFLRACNNILTEDGVLSMAIPDFRACFDHFRFPTRLAEWLQAYEEDWRQPPPHIVFDHGLNNATFLREGVPSVGCHYHVEDPSGFALAGDLREQYRQYRQLLDSKGTEYVDAHVSALTPSLFELYISDLQQLGLINLEVIEISGTLGLEFFVHLRPVRGADSRRETLSEERLRRQELLRKITADWQGTL